MTLTKQQIFRPVQMKSTGRQRKIVRRKLKIVFERIKNIVGKVENAGYQHFLLFVQCFRKSFFSKVIKSQGHIVKC